MLFFVKNLNTSTHTLKANEIIVWNLWRIEMHVLPLFILHKEETKMKRKKQTLYHLLFLSTDFFSSVFFWLFLFFHFTIVTNCMYTLRTKKKNWARKGSTVIMIQMECADDIGFTAIKLSAHSDSLLLYVCVSRLHLLICFLKLSRTAETTTKH